MSKTHDLSHRKWGSNYNVTKVYERGMRLDLCGWHLGIKDEDYLILKNGSETTRYKVESIRYVSDPSDMWFASVSFSPRESSEI